MALIAGCYERFLLGFSHPHDTSEVTGTRSAKACASFQSCAFLLCFEVCLKLVSTLQP